MNGVQSLVTPSGTNFAVLGELKDQPAPVLFVFAASAEETLHADDFCEICRWLIPRGVLCVSLSLPCHGADELSGEPVGLEGWAFRVARGAPLVSDFTTRVGEVLDYLIERNYADPGRIAVCGTSRGGFMALHFAAVEPRVRWVIAFSPVTNLLALCEFKGMENNALVQSWNVELQAIRLSERAVFMTIGNADVRVDTDAVVACARGIAKACDDVNKIADIELHVMPALGHSTPCAAHKDAATWLTKHLSIGQSIEGDPFPAS